MWVVGEVGALGGKWVPLPPYITMRALGLDAIVYIERLFSLPHWMTNFPSTNEIKKYDQISLGLCRSRHHFAHGGQKKTSTSLLSQKLQSPFWPEKQQKQRQYLSVDLYDQSRDAKTKLPHGHISTATGYVPNPIVAQVEICACILSIYSIVLSACVRKTN